MKIANKYYYRQLPNDDWIPIRDFIREGNHIKLIILENGTEKEVDGGMTMKEPYIKGI